MAHHQDEGRGFPRRRFLKGMGWAPVVFLPAPLHASFLDLSFPEKAAVPADAIQLADFRLTPHYPSKSPLEDVLRKVAPGTDEFATEKYAFEIMALLARWSRGLQAAPPALEHFRKLSCETRRSHSEPIYGGQASNTTRVLSEALA